MDVPSSALLVTLTEIWSPQLASIRGPYSMLAMAYWEAYSGIN